MYNFLTISFLTVLGEPLLRAKLICARVIFFLQKLQKTKKYFGTSVKYFKINLTTNFHQILTVGPKAT